MNLNIGKDLSKNGKCKNCIGCCGIDIPLTFEEMLFLKNKLNQNPILKEKLIKEYTKERGNIIAYCPFVDLNKKKCSIYSERPLICKIYHCNKKAGENFLLKNIELLSKMDKLKFNMLNIFPDEIQEKVRECSIIIKEKEKNDRNF